MASSAFVFNPVSIGHNFSFFLTDEGVWCCGSEAYGGLGLGDSCFNTLRKAVKVEFSQVIYSVCCGQGHTIFLDSEGKVWACGWNRMVNWDRYRFHRDMFPSRFVIFQKSEQFTPPTITLFY